MPPTYLAIVQNVRTVKVMDIDCSSDIIDSAIDPVCNIALEFVDKGG